MQCLFDCRGARKRLRCAGTRRASAFRIGYACRRARAAILASTGKPAAANDGAANAAAAAAAAAATCATCAPTNGYRTAGAGQ